MILSSFSKFLRFFLMVYLAVGVIFASLAGIYTRKVINRIDMTHRIDQISRITAAYIDEDAGLAGVCLSGSFAEGGSDFTYRWPRNIENPFQLDFKEDGYQLSRSVEGVLRISRDMMSSGCDATGKTNINFYNTNESLDSQLEKTSFSRGVRLGEGEFSAVFLAEVKGQREIFYVASVPLYPSDYNVVKGDTVSNNYFEIEPAPALAVPSYKWVGMLPFAFLFDAATFPWQILVWFEFLEA